MHPRRSVHRAWRDAYKTISFLSSSRIQPRRRRPVVVTVLVVAAKVWRSRRVSVTTVFAEAEGQVLLTLSFSAAAAVADASAAPEDDSVEPADEADDRDENLSAGGASPAEPRRYGHDADVVDCRLPLAGCACPPRRCPMAAAAAAAAAAANLLPSSLTLPMKERISSK